jgi:hypothetical protein
MGILDYLKQTGNNALNYAGQKVDNVTKMVSGATVEGAKNGALDVASRAIMPNKQDWIGTTAKTFDVNKYNVDQLSYPSDLLTPQYGGNYAIFYINISDASRLTLTEETVELDATTESRMRGSLVANAKKLTNIIDGGMKEANKVLPDAAKIDIQAVKNAVPFNGRSQRRLKTAIAMHIPNQLSVRYATMWGEMDNTANAQALMAAGSSGVNAVAEALNGNASAAKKNLSDALGTGTEAAVANKFLGPGAKNAGIVSAVTGTAANPKKEQTFQGVDFRKFTFEYQFYPRDEAEAQNVLRIIHQFKLHMHPEFKSELNYVWIYPSEFDIIYYTGGVENLNIHKHTSCILENMSVNYTPNGNFSVFANGMPTQINISLDFKELQLASKETIGLTPGGL